MRLAINPFVFLGGAIALCAVWLALRPPLPSEATAPLPSGAPRAGAPERASIDLHPATLERYVGTYEGRQRFTVELTMKNGHLLAQSPGDMVPFEMLATSETEFFLKGAGVDVEFRVEDGVVKGFVANTEFGVVIMERVH
jgi:Domain of unknown function (DUF3471)